MSINRLIACKNYTASADDEASQSKTKFKFSFKWPHHMAFLCVSNFAQNTLILWIKLLTQQQSKRTLKRTESKCSVCSVMNCASLNSHFYMVSENCHDEFEKH